MIIKKKPRANSKSKQPIEIKQIYKTVKGKKSKYVNVTVRSEGKTVNKQYKYRGGKFATYAEEAKLPKGTKYYVNYRRNEIIQNPQEVEALVKRVQERTKEYKKRTGKRVKHKSKAKVLKEFSIIPKKTYKAPEPIEAEKIINLLDGKIYYEREHSVREFSSKVQEDRFLTNILMKGTRSRKEALALMHNFDKIKLKLSYAVVVEAINKETGQTEQIATFTAIGKKPTEIIQFLKEVNLMPGDDFCDVYDDIIQPFREKLDSNAVYFNRTEGIYRITDVRLAIKFYNNPQRKLL